MVYTVTLNPAVDYILYCDKITGGITNRSLDEEIRFGGKGINVSAVLTQLDTENTALGFIAGFTGDALERGIHEMGIKTDFVRLKESYTRINIKIKAQSETEINAKGPAIDEESLNKFYHKIDKIADNDILVLAGNAPQKAYTDILKRIGHKKVLTVVDTTKQQLTDILP